MPEHAHLLIWPRLAIYGTDAILADLKRPVGQKAMGWLERHSPAFVERLTVRNRNRTYGRFWQAGPGQDHNVYNPATASAIVEYIHNNPIRRGLVGRAEDRIPLVRASWARRSSLTIRQETSARSSTPTPPPRCSWITSTNGIPQTGWGRHKGDRRIY